MKKHGKERLFEMMVKLNPNSFKPRLDEAKNDLIAGGKADKLSVEDIAKKHKVSVESIKEQIKMGKKVELEHTDNEELAEEIAMDHLEEIPDYYDRLKKMESEAKKEN